MAHYIGTTGDDSVSGAANESNLFVKFGIGADKVVGGQLNDTFVMLVDDKPDEVMGGGGQDTIDYHLSDRSLVIDLAHDEVLTTGWGNYWQPNSEVVAKVSGVENVVGTQFADHVIGTDGDNIIEGGAGADIIDGGLGNDTASYAHSSAAVDVDLSHVIQHGGDAEGDQLFSIENVIGSIFNDQFAGNSGNNHFDGGDGFDRVGYAGAAEGIKVALAAGVVEGGASTGIDTLQNIEAIQGSNFADSYNAIGFTATSTNGGGDQGDFNEFEGMGGNDLIVGNGDTRISYAHATSGVFVDIGGHTAIGDASVGFDTFTGVNNVVGSNFADELVGSDNASGTTEKFDPRGGNDFIDGRGGFDLAIYDHDPGTTTGISVDLADGLVKGDASIGTDTLREVEAIRGTDFADVYDATGFGATSTNAGSLGALNQFEGMGGDDTIIGNGHTRIVFFNATSGVTVDLSLGVDSGDASVGTDHFTGVDAVIGSKFADNIIASQHNDTLTGGGGTDTFVFRGGVIGQHAITDFTAGNGADHDVISLQQTAFSDFASVQAAAHQVGADTIISVDGGDSIKLTGVNVTALTANDFHFS